MNKSCFGSNVRVFVLVLLLVGLCLGPACKQSPQEPADQPSQQQDSAEPEPATDDQPAVAQEPAKSDEPAVDDQPAAAEQTTRVDEPAGDEQATAGTEPGSSEAEEVIKSTGAYPTGAKLVPIDIELPKPMFVGTPQDTRVPNLEKPLGRDRPSFLAPEGTKNVAAGKPVSSSDEEPIIGEIEMITDGDKEAADGSYVELGPFVQHVTVDLGARYNMWAIVLWHYHKQARVYFDVVVQVADDADFITNVNTVFNNDIDNSAGMGIGKDKHFTETAEGKLIDAKGVQGRYVRLYSNGNTSNDLNHYIEVEVYGIPAE